MKPENKKACPDRQNRHAQENQNQLPRLSHAGANLATEIVGRRKRSIVRQERLLAVFEKMEARLGRRQEAK